METLEKIELYLEGQLDPQSQDLFEKEMEQDAALKEEVATYKDIIRGIRLSGENEFMHKVHQWEKELSAKDVLESKQIQGEKATDTSNVIPLNTQKKGNSSWIFKIAAAACVLAVLTFGIWQYASVDANPQDIFNKSFQPYPTTGITNRADNNDFVKATQLYDKKDYAGAVKIYDGILDTHPDSVIVNLYAGIANLSLGKSKEATKQFESVIKSNNPNYKDAAEWYLAILPLKEGQKSAAIERLEAIRNTTGHEYREQAKALLKELR